MVPTASKDVNLAFIIESNHHWPLFNVYFYTFTALHSNILCIFLCRFYAILLRYYTLSLPVVIILHFLTSTSTVAYCHSFSVV